MTKRPFAYLGITMLCTYTAVFYFGLGGAIVAAAAAAAFLIAAFAVRKKGFNKSACIFISAVTVLSLPVFMLYDINFKNSGAEYGGREVELCAVAQGEGYESLGSVYYRLKAQSIDGEPADFKVLLKTNYDIGLKYKDKIKASVCLDSNDQNYYKSQGYVYTAFSDSFDLDCEIESEKDRGILYIPMLLHEKLVYSTKNLIPSYEGELCAAAALGARNQLNAEIFHMFSDTGLSFFIVVSGLHMSIVASLVVFLLRPRGKVLAWKAAVLAAVILCILLYMGVTGFTASVVRSGIMIILTLISKPLMGKTDSFNNLGLAAFVLIAANPYAPGDLGMLLSFASVFGILYFHPRLSSGFNEKIYDRKEEIKLLLKATNIKPRVFALKLKTKLYSLLYAAINAFFVSVSAIMAVSPLTLLLFGTANPFIVLYSMIIAPLVAIMITCTLLGAVLFYVPILSVAGYVLSFFAWISSSLILRTVGGLSINSWWSFYVDRELVFFAAAVTAAAAAIAALFKNRELHFLRIAYVFILLLSIGYTAINIVHSNSLELRLLSAGRGTVIQLSGSGSEAVLDFAGKPSYSGALREKLRSSGGYADTLAVTGDTIYDCRTAVNILNEFDVKKIMLYHSNRTAGDLEEKACYVEDFSELENGVTVKVRFNGADDYIINTGSYVWHYIVSKECSVLIAPRGGKAEVLDKKFRNPDILILGKEISGLQLLNYEESVWLSDDEEMSGLKNAVKAYGEDYHIKFK